MSNGMSEPLLSVRNLSAHFLTSSGKRVHAVEGVTFDLHKGQTLGLVGESGSGKSTAALAVLRLLPGNGRVVAGQVLLDGQDTQAFEDEKFRRQVRWKQISMVFQNAMTAFNPVMTIGKQLRDAYTYHTRASRREAESRVKEVFDLVGLSAGRMTDYPHEFSGGMKQRALIALALLCHPDVVIADEPTTALDVIVQRQILDSIRHVQNELHLSMILISHDISVVSEVCDSVAVMYGGQIVEYGLTNEVLRSPRHPYTDALLRSFPNLDMPKTALLPIEGSPPTLIEPGLGCRFAPRCSRADKGLCFKVDPPLWHGDNGRVSRCHFAGQLEIESASSVGDA